MKYIIFSTSRAYWYQEQANIAASYLSLTRGRGKVEIIVEHVSPPRNPQLILDSDGDTRFSWDWFTATFPKGDYDGVGFHLTSYYKDKWGISRRINGSKHSQNKQYPEFWMSTDKEEADGYEISNFVRLLIHEVSHFDEDLDDNNGNKLTQESVHTWDYKAKAIQHYPLVVDYRGYMFKQKVNRLMNRVIDFVSNALRHDKT